MAKNNEISFDGLNTMDFSVFKVATKADFPDGRYSGVIDKVEGKTISSKGAATLRIEVSMTIDKQTPNGAALKVKDFITFVTSNGFSWASANTWSDLCEIAGADRNLAYKLCQSLAGYLENSNLEGIRSAFREMLEISKTLPGTRVAPYIVWSSAEEGERSFANVKGSKSNQAYKTAMFEADPSVDNVDIEPLKVQLNNAVTPAPTRKRNFIQPSRA
jgi:hypothetical protein